jgi:hypothetical protein
MLDIVLTLNCNILFTSRNSFEQFYGNDTAIAHFNIGDLLLHEQTNLFEYECGRTLNDIERSTVQDILDEIHGYTLLIPLIAKTYRNDDYSLKEMQKRVKAAGLKGASGVNINHHKDLTISADLYSILCEVLNMAGLSKDETHVLRSLALLGGIIIDRKEFNAWLGGKYKNALNTLAEKNWIELHGVGENAKISLHKVIGELTCNELKPNLENCPEIRDFIWVATQKLSHNLTAVQHEWLYGYVSLDMTPVEKHRNNSLCNLLLSISKNCDFSNKYTSIVWVKIISNVTTPINDGIDEFKMYLLTYTKTIEDTQPSVYSPESLYDAYRALMIYALRKDLGDLNSQILTYAYSAVDEANVCANLSEYSEERIGEMYLRICLPIYQKICVLNFDDGSWVDLPECEALCTFVKVLWYRALKKITSNERREKFKSAYDDFCYRISHEYKSFNEQCDENALTQEDEDEISALTALITERDLQLDDKNLDVLTKISDKENVLNNLLGSENVLSYPLSWIAVKNISWNAQEKKTNLPIINELDVLGDKYNLEIYDKRLSLNFANMEAAFSYCYALVEDFVSAEKHLKNLLVCYSKVLSLRSAGVALYNISCLPGARSLLGINNSYGMLQCVGVLPPILALWFMDEIIILIENHNSLHNCNANLICSLYEKAIDFAKVANDEQKEMLYKLKIADATGVHFSY